MRVEHVLPPELLSAPRAIHILVIGAGGTGSAIVMGLPHLDQAMRVWGRGDGLEVALMDPDTVSASNCVRQPFAVSDIGQYKSIVLVNRINQFWGTKWFASTAALDERGVRMNTDWKADIVIGCVDTKASRYSIDKALTRTGDHTSYWLDLGNNASSGQYILGQPLNTRNRKLPHRLPTINELYPEITDTSLGEDPLPSCSAVESLERQEPFINQTLAASALAMLARLFRYGRLSHHGAFFNAATGHMSALTVDPSLWKRDSSRMPGKAARRGPRKHRPSSPQSA